MDPHRRRAKNFAHPLARLAPRAEPARAGHAALLGGAFFAATFALGCAGQALPPTRIVGPTFAAPPPVREPAPADETSREPPASAAHAAEAGALHAAAQQLLQLDARCPAEMALVGDRVCVDRWEASLIERAAGGERPWSPFLPVDGHEHAVRAVSRPGVLPQGYISGHQAALACVASGKRLCGAGEWEQACRGPARTQFPYGADRRAGVCNDDIRQVHPVAETGVLLGIPGAMLWSQGMNEPLVNQLPETLLPTGARAECTNGYGVFDMVGNLHEWVDDPDGTFRGGYYMDTSRNGEGCAYQTTAHDFTYHDYSTGFRCCMDPERVE